MTLLRTLDRKLLRDVARMRGQLAAVTLVLGSGVATLVTMRSTYHSLLASRDAYYARYAFADVFAHVTRAPASAARRVAGVPGVAAVTPRVVADVVADVPGLEEPATVRLVTLPEPGRDLNGVHLRRGRLPAPGAHDEVLASEAFALANGLGPGDSLAAILNGRWRRLRITGIALSPEYIFAVGAGQIMPDDRRFGVLWMERAEIEGAFDMQGAFNDISIALAPGASERDVIDAVDRVLDAFGGTGAYGRDDQISHRYITDEIRQNRVSSVWLPGIFLAVAAFLLQVVMTRLVETQREQVALLKAFGYASRTVAWHYAKLALVAVVAGGVIGTALGLWLGKLLAGYYTRFYYFPELRFVSPPSVLLTALAVSAAAALAGALTAVRRALALPPAEAMRPPKPALFRRGPLERLHLLDRLSPAARMTARNIERRPVHALVSMLGTAAAAAIVVCGLSLFDAFRTIAEIQFDVIQREDVAVTFHVPVSARAAYELAAIPGVTRVEPFRMVAARLRAGARSRRVAITGLDSTAELRRVIDRRRRPVPVTAAGLVLSAELARVLEVRAGDLLSVDLLEGRRLARSVRIAAVVDELVGVAAYADRAALDRLAGDAPRISGAFLAVDPLAASAVYRRLERMPAVAGVMVRAAARASFDKLVAQSMGVTATAIVLFAIAIAFGTVYNGARAGLAERARELASLRVLGFRRGEAAAILLGEQGLLTVIALPFGCALGLALTAWILRAATSDLFRIPLAIRPATYVAGCAVVLGSAALSALLVRRRLDAIDLVAVLKARE